MKTQSLPATDASSDITTAPLDLGDATRVCYHCNFSGADLAGDIILQGSNDNSDWITISTTAVTGAAHKMIEDDNASYRYSRLFWDVTSGTGNLTVDAVVKENVINRGA